MLYQVNSFFFVKHILNTCLLGAVFNSRSKTTVADLWWVGGSFAPREHLTMSGNSFGCYSWEGSGTDSQKVEARDAAKHLTMCKSCPTTKSFPAQHVNNAKKRNSGIKRGG